MRYCSQNLIERKDQTNPKEHCSIKKKKPVVFKMSVT